MYIENIFQGYILNISPISEIRTGIYLYIPERCYLFSIHIDLFNDLSAKWLRIPTTNPAPCIMPAILNFLADPQYNTRFSQHATVLNPREATGPRTPVGGVIVFCSGVFPRNQNPGAGTAFFYASLAIVPLLLFIPPYPSSLYLLPS